MDIASFRTNFPEFSDTVRYPDSQITFWATLAEAQVNANVWKNQTTIGVNLYVAHEITMAARNVQVSTNGATPGDSSGPVQTKSVGDVSLTYDTQQAAEDDGGWWNLTQYGKQYYRLSKLYGAGAIQLGANPYGYSGYYPC